jgi:hypothetical protein
LGRLHSHEVVEEARNLRREGDLFGETPLLAYFKTSKVRGVVLRRRVPRPRRRDAAERRCGPVFKGPEAVDEVVSVHSVLERPHPIRGVSKSFGSCAGVFGRRCMCGPSRSGRVEIPRRERRKL